MSLYESRPDWPYHVSAGGVVFREEAAGRRYALLYREPAHALEFREHTSWHLPKGTLDEEESLEQCAQREVREESGLETEIVAYLGAITREFTLPAQRGGKSINKTTHYFLLRYRSGSADDMDPEHDGLDWFTQDEAIAKLAQMPKSEEQIIQRAEDYFAAFPA